jgi:hypothetical protein
VDNNNEKKEKQKDFPYILSVSMIDVSYSKQNLIGKHFGIFLYPLGLCGVIRIHI